MTPEVAPIEKNKPKRSAKPKREQPEKPADTTIETHPAAEPDKNISPVIKPPNGFDWDRTSPPPTAAQKAEDEVIRRTPFPLPNAKTLPFPQFSEYWNALIKDPVSRYARLYIRRWYPGMLPQETESHLGTKRQGYPREKTLHATDGPVSELKILSEVGVGDYTIRLNDTRRPFEQATIVHCEKFATARDWEHYPPLINPELLDWDDPANAVYIKWGQSRGIFRKDDERQKDESDMANAAVVTQLLEQNKALTEQVVNSKPTVVAPSPTPPPKSENGDSGALKAVADLAIAVLNRPQPAAATGGDPMALVKGVVDMVKAITPAPDTSSAELAKEVVKGKQASDERMFQLQQQQLDQARAELKEVRTAAAVPPTVVNPPAPPTEVDVLERMVKQQTLLKQLTGRGGSHAEEERASNVDKWLEAAPIIGPVVQSFIGGIFQTIHFGFQTWQQISYNNALIKNGAEPKPPMTTNAKPPEPGQPIAPSGPQPTPEQQAQQQQLQLILGQVAKLIGPLNRALQNSKTGAEFAEMVIEYTEEGRADYDRIRNVAETLTRIGMQIQGQPGVDQFKNAAAYLFSHFQQFWQKVSNLPTFGTFLEEFYEYDKIAAQQEDNQP